MRGVGGLGVRVVVENIKIGCEIYVNLREIEMEIRQGWWIV